ncbi:UNKNOWN [Stylonychia lemnae]|uniref:Uncharacterized protein n=1 Tax=Stylonychia lemnae TaxID=5949 RepID=A0A077ZU66_STYLE|nr:UNKNOWN [Stylonychia lemnae]|eukprot:CDW72006.1 UNKNOWN [Stylonychia lemnae]
MNKALVLALFLGLAVANESQGWFWPNDDASLKYLVQEEQYALGYGAQADFGYGSHYKINNVNPSKEEIYGLHIYSFASVYLEATVTRFYKWHGDFFFEPLYWEVYNQHLSWVRPESDNDFHFYVQGDRMGRALSFTTTVKENAQTFETSLVRWMRDMDNNDPYPSSSDVKFDDDYEQESNDNYWGTTFSDEIDGLTDLLTANYYGPTKLF